MLLFRSRSCSFGAAYLIFTMLDLFTILSISFSGAAGSKLAQLPPDPVPVPSSPRKTKTAVDIIVEKLGIQIKKEKLDPGSNKDPPPPEAPAESRPPLSVAIPAATSQRSDSHVIIEAPSADSRPQTAEAARRRGANSSSSRSAITAPSPPVGQRQSTLWSATDRIPEYKQESKYWKGRPLPPSPSPPAPGGRGYSKYGKGGRDIPSPSLSSPIPTSSHHPPPTPASANPSQSPAGRLSPRNWRGRGGLLPSPGPGKEQRYWRGEDLPRGGGPTWRGGREELPRGRKETTRRGKACGRSSSSSSIVDNLKVS